MLLYSSTNKPTLTILPNPILPYSSSNKPMLILRPIASYSIHAKKSRHSQYYPPPWYRIHPHTSPCSQYGPFNVTVFIMFHTIALMADWSNASYAHTYYTTCLGSNPARVLTFFYTSYFIEQYLGGFCVTYSLNHSICTFYCINTQTSDPQGSKVKGQKWSLRVTLWNQGVKSHVFLPFWAILKKTFFFTIWPTPILS